MAIELTAQPASDWTTRQLRAWIRRATQDLNREFLDLQETTTDLKKDNPLLYEQRNRLIELGTGKEYKDGIGLGLTYKTKSELIMQARALRETYNILETPEQYEKAIEKTEKAYATFTRNRPGLNMSFAEYKQMTETIGAMGQHALHEFGYESFIEKYDEARSEGRSNRSIMDAVVEAQRAQRNDRSRSWTPESMIDFVNDYLHLGE